MISKFELDLHFTMLYPFVNFEIDASFKNLLNGNKKCDATDDDDATDEDDVDRVMVPMCRPCFAGDKKVWQK